MSELYSDSKTRVATEFVQSPLAPLQEAALARRRRLVRYMAALTFIGGLGLSAIPGAKTGVEHRITSSNDRGARTQVHEFSFGRGYGFPFRTAQSQIAPSGEVERVSLHPEGVLGNLAFALAGAISLSILLNRRRR
jgi:hypothetical protein